LRSLAHQYFRYGRGRSRTVRRHPGSMRLRQLLVPTSLLLSTAGLAIAPWLPVALLLPGGYLAILAGASVALSIRHRSWDAVSCGPAAGIMHSAWAVGFFLGLLDREAPLSHYDLLPLEPASAGGAA